MKDKAQAHGVSGRILTMSPNADLHTGLEFRLQAVPFWFVPLTA